MNYYTLVVAYDGTNYHGWQRQKNVPSIAATMEDSFSTVFHVPLFLKGASRTDAGVHAAGQVVSICTPLVIDAEKMRQAWNYALPSTIVIRSIVSHSKQVNIFKDIDYKIYYYHFFLKRPLPFVQQYGWYIKQPLNISKLIQGLQIFKGTHDFTSFCSSEDTRQSMIRTIDHIELEFLKRYNVYRIKVIGPAFLRHMIRRIVGACLTVATQDALSPSALLHALEEKNHEQTLPNAPAKGLLLYKIKYKYR